jgi:hypothetical protein
VIIGATPEGNKELVGLTDGVRENAQSWKGLLLDLKRRGLVIGPELAVADGALGFWQAIEEVWPKPAVSAAGCTRRPTCSIGCRRASNPRPSALSACPGGDCGASHSDDSAKCYPLKVEVHRPRESALTGWQPPQPNKYSRSPGGRRSGDAD